MQTKSRTLYTLKNIKIGLFCQLLTLIISFLSRTIFILVLGNEYLGLSGLFTNILTILSFAELGIGNALVFSMYKPLAEKNESKLCALMKLYGKCYRIIAILITIFGIFFIPLLPYIIKEKPDINESLVVIYILFLLNTIVSYLFSYKKSIIIADQKNYIILITQQIFLIVQTLVQAIILIFTKNYVLYLIVQIIFTLINNIILSKVSDKAYPFLMRKNSESIPKNEIEQIFQNVKSLILYKFGSVILNGTDNIIISSFIGVGAVGYVSNYLLIINAVGSVLGQIVTSFTASVGNLNATGTPQQKENVFNKLFLFSVWLYGIASILLITLLQSFIDLWIGREYELSYSVVFFLVFHFFINNIQFAAYTYRNTMGLFNRGKYCPVIASFLNIILSIYLVNKIGLSGIFLATIIARLLTMGWYDPLMVFEIGFNKKPYKYYITYLWNIMVFIINLLININVVSKVVYTGFIGLFLKAIICFFVSNIIFILLNWNNEYIKYGIKKIITGLLSK